MMKKIRRFPWMDWHRNATLFQHLQQRDAIIGAARLCDHRIYDIYRIHQGWGDITRPKTIQSYTHGLWTYIVMWTCVIIVTIMNLWWTYQKSIHTIVNLLWTCGTIVIPINDPNCSGTPGHHIISQWPSGRSSSNHATHPVCILHLVRWNHDMAMAQN